MTSFSLASSTPLKPDFEPAHFRKSLSRFATGVTVITTFGQDALKGDISTTSFVGITASSFNSVSLSPPLVLWSLDLKSRCFDFFQSASHYVINVLADDQVDVCNRFAFGQGDRFAETDYSLGQCGLPILKGALAWFECHNRSRYEEGDHLIMVGEVERCAFASEGQPLVYQNSQFRTTAPMK